MELPNAVISTLTYDDAGRLLSIEHEKGAQTLSSFDYTYDDVGNRTQAIDVLSSSTTIDYTYDPLYRLTEADYSTNEYFTYTYDEVGNRLTQETQAGTNEYTYDAADRLTEVDSVTYTWDDNGNLLDDGVREYSYDHANRLTQVEIGTDTYEFVYNGLGDRLRQIVNSAPTTYALDLNAGLTQVLGDGSSLFLYGLGRIGEEQSGDWQYHLGDALASVRQLTNAAGSVTLSQSFEPFGAILASSGGASSQLGFAGEWTDATELVHLRARYYDPSIGRFLSRDPLPGLPTHPGSRHPYAYAYLNPVRFVDPSGQFVPLALLGVGLAGGILGGLGYYGYQQLRNADPCFGVDWNWGEAAFWGGLGGLLGTGTVAAGYYAGLHLGLWGPGGRLLLNQLLGRFGEWYVGLRGAKEAISSITGTAQRRIPDAIWELEQLLIEVKNVSYQSFTNQLKDFALYAQEENLTFVLLIRQSTRLSAPLVEAINEFNIIVVEAFPW